MKRSLPVLKPPWRNAGPESSPSAATREGLSRPYQGEVVTGTEKRLRITKDPVVRRTMRHWILPFAVCAPLLGATAPTATAGPPAAVTRSRLAGSGAGDRSFQADLPPPGGRVVSISANVGRWNKFTEVVKGLRFVCADA